MFSSVVDERMDNAVACVCRILTGQGDASQKKYESTYDFPEFLGNMGSWDRVYEGSSPDKDTRVAVLEFNPSGYTDAGIEVFYKPVVMRVVANATPIVELHIEFKTAYVLLAIDTSVSKATSIRFVGAYSGDTTNFNPYKDTMPLRGKFKMGLKASVRRGVKDFYDLAFFTSYSYTNLTPPTIEFLNVLASKVYDCLKREQSTKVSLWDYRPVRSFPPSVQRVPKS